MQNMQTMKLKVALFTTKVVVGLSLFCGRIVVLDFDTGLNYESDEDIDKFYDKAQEVFKELREQNEGNLVVCAWDPVAPLESQIFPELDLLLKKHPKLGGQVDSMLSKGMTSQEILEEFAVADKPLSKLESFLNERWCDGV